MIYLNIENQIEDYSTQLRLNHVSTNRKLYQIIFENTDIKNVGKRKFQGYCMKIIVNDQPDQYAF